MKEQFKAYLTKQGYSITTPAGNPSTVYDYVKRVNKACEWENTTWTGLASNVNNIAAMYDIGGAK